MVAILACDSDVVDRLDRQAAFGRPVQYSEAWRRSMWQGAEAHLAILVDEDLIVRRLGRVQGGKRVTSRDRGVLIAEIEEIEPLPLAQVTGKLSAAHADATRQRGILTPAAGRAVVQVLLELLPDRRGLIQILDRETDWQLPGGARGELLNQERDAVGMLLEIAGIDRKVLRTWSLSTADVPFLEGMPRYREREDVLIDHDIGRFGSWVDVPNVRVGWRAFTEGKRRIFIMNANRSPVEHTLGVDVVYYNEDRNSFILVQYKKMQREQLDGSHVTSYRPDKQLDRELERMQRVDKLCADQPGEFRLLSTACWLKLCDPSPLHVDHAALIKGMYFAREHFVELLSTAKGPRKGRVIGYHNVPRHLNNTMFTELVADGWLGSRGPATIEIQRLIRDSLATGHAVTFGVQSSSHS